MAAAISRLLGQWPRLIRGHAGNKRFGFAEHFPQARHRGGGINRRITRDAPEIRIRITSVAANLVDDPFRREAQGLTHRSPYDGAQRQNPLMDGQQVHHVTRLLTPVGRSNFVGGEVNRVQNITKSFIPQGGENRKSLSATHSSLVVAPSRSAMTVYTPGPGRIHFTV